MIRSMKESDLPQVLRIEEQLFTPPWNEAQFRYELFDNPYAHLYVLEEAGEILGYIDYWITFETAQLANIATAPGHQHQGVATSLMDAMIADCEAAMCENITLEVRIDNEVAKALYQRYDFIKVATRKQYYQDGCDGDLMIKALGGNYR